MLHILQTSFYPSPPALLCPNPGNLSSELFTWSPYTAAALIAIIAAAPIRLLAFRQLGRNFTFRLARPSSLVTGGLYAYVQHPSYPTNWVVLVGNIALLLRLDGVFGCVLPGWVVRSGMGMGMGNGQGIGVWPVFLGCFVVMVLWIVWVRVKDEEAMLKREFGREWEEYHGRTKRFVPGVI